MTIFDHSVEYSTHRIHLSPLKAGLWVGMIVSLKVRKPLTKDSLTDTVTRIPGEYRSEAQAIAAAKRYIDDEDTHQPE